MSVVIVDDRDPRIQYSPSTGWKQGSHFEQYLTTTTVATGTAIDQTATFSFQGTSLAVYGTVTQGRSTMSFSLDQGVPSVFDASFSSSGTVHHKLLFASGTLTDGQHTLVMTQTSGTNSIFLDYLLSNMTLSAGNTLFFDDSDTRLEYSPGWNVAPGSEQYLQNTARSCGLDQCTVALDFEGNSLTVYGDFAEVNVTTTPPSFNASITVDDGPPTPIQFSVPFGKPQPTSNFAIYSTQLTPGSHRAVLTTHQTDQFLLDYFVAEVPAAPAVPTTSPSTSIQPTGSASGLPDTHSPSPSRSSLKDLGSSKVPVGAIVGIAVGGLVFLIVLLVAMLLWRRRARRLDEDGAIRHDPSMSVGQESFSALAPPSLYQPSRPLSSFSVASLATYVEPSVDGSISEKDGPVNIEARKGRPASRYLYYESDS